MPSGRWRYAAAFPALMAPRSIWAIRQPSASATWPGRTSAIRLSFKPAKSPSSGRAASPPRRSLWKSARPCSSPTSRDTCLSPIGATPTWSSDFRLRLAFAEKYQSPPPRMESSLVNQRLQPGDPVLDGRMAGEDGIGPFLEFLDGIGDVEVGGAAVGGFEVVRVCVDLAQSVGQPQGIARQLDGGGVGQIFALAADGELDELGQDGGDDGQDDGHDEQDHHDDAAPLAAALAAPPPPPPHIPPRNLIQL